MKILAIRGCNLASLAGEFEIDLSRAPFTDAGVFAIVGNTGAGKSTLLDALCVALFDRTPRLTNHSRVLIGRGEDDPGALGAQDVRTILRRGSVHGWAEVDFESGDARRYRARWSVRRARGQTDGTLQDQQVSLTAIDGGERLGGTKTETLKAISSRLGLTFDQFRRSALLAQGEFAAFLRADGKDRSELLERMTGTEIYTRLSVAAHVKAALAEQQLRDGRSAAMAIAVLDDAARADTELQLAAATEAKSAARTRLAAAEAVARWRAEAEQRAAAVVAAEADHATFVAASEAAEVDRAELVLRRRAEQLRAPWDEAARIDRMLAIARSETTAAEHEDTRAREAHAEIAVRRRELVTLHEPVRAARIAARLVERSLSHRPDLVGAPLRPAGVLRGDGAVAALRDAADAAAWVVGRIALAPEVAGWSELDVRFGQLGALAEAVGGLDRALREHASTRGKLLHARDAMAVERAGAVAAHAEAQRKAASFHQRRGPTLDEAHRRENEARTREREVDRLVSIAAGAREAIKARDELDRQLVELDEAARSDAELHARIEVDKRDATTLRTERTRVVVELRKAAGYEHARTELRDGEACPLCGALEHPWRDRGAFDEVIREAELRLAEVASAFDAATTQLAAIAARSHGRERERLRLARLRALAVTSAEAAVGTWRDQLAALGELLLERDPSTKDAERIAAELEANARESLEKARAVFSQTQAATKAAQDAQSEVQLAQAAVDRVQQLLGEHERHLADLDATIQQLNAERSIRIERRAELEGEVAAAIARWRAALPARAVARGSELSRRVSDRRPSRGDRVEIPDDVAAARIVIGELATEWRVRAERIVVADAAAVAALAALDRELAEAERATTEHAARHADCARRRDVLHAELLAAAERLEAARASAGFDAEELPRLLAGDPSRVDELADKLAALDRAVDRTRAVVAERRARVAEHEAMRPGAVDAADSVATLAALVTETESLVTRLAGALTADDEARTRRTTALAAIAVREVDAEIDRVLGEVIGSHDGKLFRSFAQSLTLDGLLAVANAHLDELAPRYQLERVPRHDLELQVIDRDLGNEVRSVQSLSGGESFLVSLALALGLSSMSAHDVRVRTLLIDEGFGTLDPSTLDTALSVLDALQATGRQVGVISHVPALVERVGAHVRVVQRGGGKSEVIVA